MDDFQFKPLTEGLGFHRKPENKTPNTEPAKPTRAQRASQIESTLQEISQDLAERGLESDFLPPLPRKGLEIPKQRPQQSPASSTVDEILKTLHEKRKHEFVDRKKNRVSLDAAPTTYKPAAWEFSASLLDMMLVVAANLLCLIVLLLVTKVDLFASVFAPQSEGVYLALIAMVTGTTWIYLVANRIFLGHTAGEWVFDQRLGTPEQMKKSSYGAKVAVRSAIIIATGFIFIPVLSALLNRDVLGRWMGLELVKKA